MNERDARLSYSFMPRTFVLLLLAGCAHATPPAERVFVAPVCALARAPQKPVDSTPARTGACFRNGRPKTIVLEKKEKYESCSPIDAAELGRVEARLRKEFVVYQKPSKLVIDFGCDALSSAVREVVIEDGSGHGGTLRIVQFVRGPSSVDVRMIDSSHYFSVGSSIATATMGVADFDAMVARARVAVLARPHDIPLYVPGAGLGMSGSYSSNDFHLGIAIRDRDDHLVARHFTGYESSDAQGEILPMRMATERFEAAIDSLAFSKRAVTDDDKALFARQFLAAMNDKPEWWITEFYVTLADTLGTIDIVPALAKIAQQKGDASADRARPVALEAIGRITGWDPFRVENAKSRDVDGAAAAVARECIP